MDTHRLITDKKAENYQQDQIFPHGAYQDIGIGFIKAKNEIKAEEEGKGISGSGIATPDGRHFHVNLLFS
jgi:hypothetical protein